VHVHTKREIAATGVGQGGNFELVNPALMLIDLFLNYIKSVFLQKCGKSTP